MPPLDPKFPRLASDDPAAGDLAQELIDRLLMLDWIGRELRERRLDHPAAAEHGMRIERQVREIRRIFELLLSGASPHDRNAGAPNRPA